MYLEQLLGLVVAQRRLYARAPHPPAALDVQLVHDVACHLVGGMHLLTTVLDFILF